MAWRPYPTTLKQPCAATRSTPEGFSQSGAFSQSQPHFPSGLLPLVLRCKHTWWRRQGLDGIRVAWVSSWAVNGQDPETSCVDAGRRGVQMVADSGHPRAPDSFSNPNTLWIPTQPAVLNHSLFWPPDDWLFSGTDIESPLIPSGSFGQPVASESCPLHRLGAPRSHRYR